MGCYYYWGFIVDGIVVEVIGKLWLMVSNVDCFCFDGIDYVCMEVKIGSFDWIVIKMGLSSVL